MVKTRSQTANEKHKLRERGPGISVITGARLVTRGGVEVYEVTCGPVPPASPFYRAASAAAYGDFVRTDYYRKTDGATLRGFLPKVSEFVVRSQGPTPGDAAILGARLVLVGGVEMYEVTYTAGKVPLGRYYLSFSEGGAISGFLPKV